MTRLLTILLCLTAALAVTAQRQRTTMTGRLRAQPVATDTAAIIADTITAGLDNIVRLSGYDKPISASRETLHATNLSDSLTITGMTLEISYLDNAGRELHRRTVMLHNTIHSATTELVSFPTWDLQRSFYYRLSVAPRRQATPYDVKVTILNIAALPPTQH